MNEAEKFQLEKEVAVAREKELVFNTHIKPFLDAKKYDLFEAFSMVSVTDTNALLNIRLQMQALTGLEADFQSYIDTGKIASFKLENEQ